MKYLISIFILFLISSCTTVQLHIKPPHPSQTQLHVTTIDKDDLFESGKITIIRDNWGTPHIYGEKDSDTAFGLAYAHAQDDFVTIQEQLLHARGKYASVYGKGKNNINASLDYLVGLLKINETVDNEYQNLSDETIAICEGYADGLNYYIEKNKDNIKQYIYPVHGKDIARGFVYKNPFFFDLPIYISFLFDMAPEEIPETITIDDILDLITKGSNVFAVSPNRTPDNSTLLAINSHQPWEGSLAWYEAHLHSNDGWNISGGLFPGSPIILVGFNEHLGWGHTVNDPDILDIYELTINPDNPKQYYFNNEWIDFEEFNVDISIKLLGKKGVIHSEPAYWSVYGPVIKGSKATYAIRYSWDDSIKSVEQWYKMNKATNFNEWNSAMSMMAIPMFNAGYADKDGNIFYIYNAKLPIRDNKYDWKRVVAGNSSETLWTEFIPYEKLPKVMNPPSGFIINCNNTPMFTTLNNNPEINFSDNYYSGIETKMTNRALRSMDLFVKDSTITYNDFKNIKFDLQYAENSNMAEYVNRTKELIKESQDSYLLKAFEVLNHWDLGTEKNNINAALPIISFGRFVDSYIVSDERLLLQLNSTIKFLYKNFNSLKIEWGSINRLIRGTTNLSLSGGPDILRAIYPNPNPMKNGQLKSIAGDAYMALVQWDENGNIKSESIHQFGSSISNVNSKHYADQAYLFSDEKLKPAYLDIENILNNVESIDIIIK